MPKLTRAQRSGLAELKAACDERAKYGPDSEQWVRTLDLSGSPHERSAANMRRLVALGLADGKKYFNDSPQSQWAWRITAAGRAALEEQNDG